MSSSKQNIKKIHKSPYKSAPVKINITIKFSYKPLIMYVQIIKLFSTDSMPHLASQYGFALESLLFCCCHFLGGEQEMVGGDGFICLTTPHFMHPCLVFLSPSFFFLFSLSLSFSFSVSTYFPSLPYVYFPYRSLT